jgi:MFS family permease
MVIFGYVQDKRGPRFTATLGSILVGCGFISSGFTKSPILLVLTIGVIAGSGIGIHTVTTAPTAVKWYPANKKGLITGIVSSGAAISSLIYSPLGRYLLNSVGINYTFLYIGIGALVLTTFLSQFLKYPETYMNTEEIKTTSTTIDRNYKYLLKDKYFYKLWTMYFLASSVGLMIISHISSISKIQTNLEVGYILIIFISVFNSIGRILGGYSSDKIGRINLLRLVFIVGAINLFLFNYYNGLISMIIGVSVAGICYGSLFSVFPAAVSDRYGAKYYGQNYGLMFTAWGFGGILGPMAGAAIYDEFNQYTIAYILAFMLLSISFLIAMTIKD